MVYCYSLPQKVPKKVASMENVFFFFYKLTKLCNDLAKLSR